MTCRKHWRSSKHRVYPKVSYTSLICEMHNYTDNHVCVQLPLCEERLHTCMHVYVCTSEFLVVLTGTRPWTEEECTHFEQGQKEVGGGSSTCMYANGDTCYQNKCV